MLIADDHHIFRDGLASILKRLPYVVDVYHAENGMRVINHPKLESVDVVLMDINMPVMNGIETTVKIIKRHPTKIIIAMTMHDSEEYVKLMMDAGCMGYLLKSANFGEIDKALQNVVQGKKYLSEEVNDRFYEMDLNTPSQQSFNEREIEILKLLCKEYSTREISDALFVSIKTIELYRQKLLTKTNSKNIAGLVVYAIEKGFYRGDKK
jgi:DNA-binding NarL/FixJ family response regulator